MEVRRPLRGAVVHRAHSNERELSAEELHRFSRMAEQVGLSRERQREVLDDCAWKVRALPGNCAAVAVVGCGSGAELLCVRAVLPNTQLVAYDWQEQLLPGVAQVTNTTFFAGNFLELISASSVAFDAIFSNHVLEHMYAPESALAILRECLSSSGVLVAALPLEAMPDGPHTERMLAAATHPESIHPLDLLWLNAGHCWQTNPADLQATLLEAGYRDCELIQLEDAPSRGLRESRAQFDRSRKAAVRAFDLTFGAVHDIARRLTDTMPRVVLKFWFAGESRVPFGSTRLRVRYAEEILAVARKGSGD